MKAGEVTSSYPISLSKAAAVLSRFAASDTGARPEVTAYLRRSLTAFKELVAVHRDIRAHRKISHVEEEECASKNDDNRHTTKKKKRKGNYYEVEAHAANSVFEQQEEMGGSSKKKMEALDSVKNSEEKRHWKENKGNEYQLRENGRVGFVSENMNTERKKRKLSDAVQGKVDKKMNQHEGKKKKKRTIEITFCNAMAKTIQFLVEGMILP
ncbi:uncharacterized protein LOC110036420 isoform X2 [Phalaenopsis equestris]|uniref:uncharacterized protein LOC110036420 isoform X2 n=1 Tax=Phalaenopsis equestris TaxID=78828 RepID=UPI0009E3335E|nr:uncharacterized protein LOC110036420 isoform X2 [Phalaenopsis equestris]